MKNDIIFDLDGTLVNSREGIVKSVHYALEFLGIVETEPEKLERFIGPPLQDSFRRFYQLDEIGTQRAIQRYRERYARKGVLECTPYKGIPQLLAHLRGAGKGLYVATSKPQVFADQILAEHGLADYFSCVMGASLDGSLIRKEDVLHALFEEIGEAHRAQAVMVGDRKYDVLGAAACGIPCIGVYYGFAESGELEEAGAVDVADTPQALGRLLMGEKS